MSTTYETSGSIVNENFGVEIMDSEEFMNDDQAKDDFWRLLSELLEEEKVYHDETGISVNGVYTKESAFGVSYKWKDVFFLLDKDNKRIGCAETAYDHKFGTYHIGCVIVTKSYRGRGLGKFLMNCIMNEYPGQEFSLNVSLGNPSGIKFYESLGFHPTDYKMHRPAK